MQSIEELTPDMDQAVHRACDVLWAIAHESSDRMLEHRLGDHIAVHLSALATDALNAHMLGATLTSHGDPGWSPQLDTSEATATAARDGLLRTDSAGLSPQVIDFMTRFGDVFRGASHHGLLA